MNTYYHDAIHTYHHQQQRMSEAEKQRLAKENSTQPDSSGLVKALATTGTIMVKMGAWIQPDDADAQTTTPAPNAQTT